jgi:hypothetical protein
MNTTHVHHPPWQTNPARFRPGHWLGILLFMLCSGFAAETETHWSLQPLRPVAVPDLQDPWIANPIDAFILARLRSEGLPPSPPADAQTLVRRMFLVMHGLPPSPDERIRWESDTKDLVDFLLQSPRYGERWAQHWLDVIRWAETVGFETNSPRPNAWPYRDWLIDSLNADKPYARFLFEQLAGDTVGEDAALGFLVAGPANLPGQIGRDEESMRQARQDELDEVIRTVGQAFFGLTLGCARCHDHKFDPITARDYYSMQAIFAGLRYGDRRWRGTENDRWTAELPEAARKVAALENELGGLQSSLGLLPSLADQQEEQFRPMIATAVRMRINATANGSEPSLYEFEVWNRPTPGEPPVNVALVANGGRSSASSFALENQTRHPDNLNDGTSDPRLAFPWKAAKGGSAWIQIDLKQPTRIDRVTWSRGMSVPVDYEIQIQDSQGSWQTVANTRRRFPRRDDQRKPADLALEDVSPEQQETLAGLLADLRSAQARKTRLAAGPQVYGAVFSTPEPTWLINRGDPMQRVETVPPSAPAALGNWSLGNNSQEPDARIALARHLTDPGHPLTARVIVNRVWQHHFGTGLVTTPSDFGKMGSRPSHPELLDWLAAEFLRTGGSLKRLHRLILESNTFRQANTPRAECIARDADTRLLWRFPPRRLDAEAIRDSILTVAGTLNRKMGGVGFDFFNQKGGLSDYTPHETFPTEGLRRMIYATKIRMQSVEIFGAFDCPDAGQMKPTRSRSITPIQSLGLMNSPFVNHQASLFANRIRHDAGTNLETQVTLAMDHALGRPASPGELLSLKELAGEHGLEQVCRVLFNANEFVHIP